jgi:hypothetical protein
MLAVYFDVECGNEETNIEKSESLFAKPDVKTEEYGISCA